MDQTKTVDLNSYLDTVKVKTGDVKKYISLDTWQYLIIIGIAVSGVATLVTAYNAISNINQYYQTCSDNSKLHTSINIKFGILLVISVLIILSGIGLAWAFKKSNNQRRLLTLGLITTGLFGILYSFSLKFQGVVDWVKLLASLFTFVIFLALGWFLSRKKELKFIAKVTYS